MKVLFVCLGNICRSPTAEAIFREKFRSIDSTVEFDSAGTAAYHAGEPSDARSIRAAEKLGYKMNHISRQVVLKDFEDFDFIFAMDKSNFQNLHGMCPRPDQKSKIFLITDFCSDKEIHEVSDPYYGPGDGFLRVITILENCVSGVAKMIGGDGGR